MYGKNFIILTSGIIILLGYKNVFGGNTLLCEIPQGAKTCSGEGTEFVALVSERQGANLKRGDN